MAAPPYLYPTLAEDPKAVADIDEMFAALRAALLAWVTIRIDHPERRA